MLLLPRRWLLLEQWQCTSRKIAQPRRRGHVRGRARYAFRTRATRHTTPAFRVPSASVRVHAFTRADGCGRSELPLCSAVPEAVKRDGESVMHRSWLRVSKSLDSTNVHAWRRGSTSAAVANDATPPSRVRVALSLVAGGVVVCVDWKRLFRRSLTQHVSSAQTKGRPPSKRAAASQPATAHLHKQASGGESSSNDNAKRDGGARGPDKHTNDTQRQRQRRPANQRRSQRTNQRRTRRRRQRQRRRRRRTTTTNERTTNERTTNERTTTTNGVSE